MFYSHIDSFLIKGNKLRQCDEIATQLSAISESLNNISNLYQEMGIPKLSEVPTNEFIDSVSRCHEAINESESVLWELREKAKKEDGTNHYSDKYSSTLRELRELDYACNNLLAFIYLHLLTH